MRPITTPCHHSACGDPDYRPLHRLIRETPPAGISPEPNSFGYDADSNRTSTG